MRNRLIIPILLFMTFAYSCNNSQKQKINLTEVSGIYSIGMVEIDGGKDILDSLESIGVLNFKESEFKFQGNDTVSIDKESAQKFFEGETMFKYEFINNSFILTNNETKIEIPCSVSKNFKNVDLEIDYSGIKKIGLMRLNR